MMQSVPQQPQTTDIPRPVESNLISILKGIQTKKGKKF